DDTGTNITWTVSLDAGETLQAVFKVTVNEGTEGSSIVNEATVVANGYEIKTNTTTSDVPEDPIKDVVDESGTSVDGNKVAVGDVLTYTIDYTNTSDETEEVIITDTVPTGTTYVADSAKVYVEGNEVTTDGAVKVADGAITWTVSLEAGESVQAVFKVTVTEETSVVNQATVVANGYEIKTNTTTSDVPEDPIKDVVDESGTSVDGNKVAVGDVLTYTIDYTNTSDETEEVVITDAVPEGTGYVSNSASATITDVNGDEVDKNVTIDDTGTNITWTVSLDAGETVQAVFKVTVNEGTEGDSIVNEATVVANDYEIKTNTVTNDVPGDPVKDVVDESGTSIAGDKVAVGDVLTYTIDYTNTSDETEEVVITDAVPAGTAYVANSASATVTDVNGDEIDKTVTINDNGANITWTASLDAGESVQAVFKVSVEESAINTTIENQASLKIDNSYTINTNTTENPEDSLIDISGTKYWIDNDNDDGLRPNSITVGLYKVVNGDEELLKTTTTDSNDNYSFTDLPKYNDSNEEIEYVVRELDDDTSVDDGQIIEYDGITYIVHYDENSYDITNILTKDIVVVKDWNIDEEATINAPDSINVKLTSDDTEITAQLTKEKQYTYTFEDLPVYNSDGSLIEYTINEYDSNQSYNDGDLYPVTLDDNSTAVFLVRYDSQDDGIDTYVTITNTYPVYTLEFSGTKTLDNAKPGENDYSFVVKEGEETITTGYSDEEGNISFAINYTVADLGEHIYTITEAIGDDKSINYDTTDRTIVVNVTYVDGVLSAVIDSTESDEITFNNTSKTTTADIEAKKVLENKDLTEEFSFTLKDSVGNEIETVSNDEEGSIKFTTLENLKVGEYNYTITENIPDGVDDNNTLNGIQYDSTTWNVKVIVSVDETTNTLVSKVTYAKGNGEYSDSLATFTNTYSSSPTYDTITATKTLNGKELTEGAFTFKITESVGAPLPEGYDSTNGITNDINGSIVFGKITFESKGTYVYEISEVNANQTGYSYDDSTYVVTYVVEDDGNGSLGITSKIITLNGKEVDSIAFENSYQPLEVSTDTTIGGLKDINIIDGTFELEDGQFTFALTNVNTGKVEQTVQNDSEGYFSFDEITFTEAGEFTYKVTETSSNITGISDDSNYYTITFTVEDQDGQLVITKTIITDANDKIVDSLGSLNFTNTYNPTEITYSITGIKVISNTDASTNRQVKAGEFTFEINAEGDSPLPENTTVTNDADGNISFGEMTFNQTGTYTYYVKEVRGNDSTITYDETVYTIVITITDVDGYLSASANVTNENIVFTNSYTPTEVVVGPSGNVNISGSKSYTDKDGNALDITDGQFSFELIDSNDETISTAKTNSDGTFIFDNMTYDTVGTYKYTVKEVNSTSYDGITYDTTVYDVIVNVTEDTEANALVATVTYMLDGENVKSMSFVNSYSATPAIIHLVGTKIYTGATLNEGQFTYQLLDSDNNVIITATNDADGTIDFGTLTYETIGTYTYTISEVNDEQENVTYDDSVYKVEVIVSDNGLGELVAHISYSVDNEEKATVIFENIYAEISEEPTTPTTPDVTSEETPDTTTTETTEVKTDDNSSYELWISMMGLSIIGYIYYRKKRYHA
ncbi:MAG: Cna B-type domain-containing protein, partial [Erysipelotrichaceae bacterium]|nr:Cna B-type domain-containing protein [Erysipelotrichaceae bacterium]